MRTMTKHLERKEVTGARETRSFAIQIKAAGDDGSIEGYGSVFGVLDNWADVIEQGAFAASLAAHKAAGTMPEPCSKWAPSMACLSASSRNSGHTTSIPMSAR